MEQVQRNPVCFNPQDQSENDDTTMEEHMAIYIDPALENAIALIIAIAMTTTAVLFHSWLHKL